MLTLVIAFICCSNQKTEYSNLTIISPKIVSQIDSFIINAKAAVEYEVNTIMLSVELHDSMLAIGFYALAPYTCENLIGFQEFQNYRVYVYSYVDNSDHLNEVVNINQEFSCNKRKIEKFPELQIIDYYSYFVYYYKDSVIYPEIPDFTIDSYSVLLH